VAHRQLRDFRKRVGTQIVLTSTEQCLFGCIGPDRGRTDTEQRDRRSIDRAGTIEAHPAGTTHHREVSVTTRRFVDRESVARRSRRETGSPREARRARDTSSTCRRRSRGPPPNGIDSCP
jgi:hypothetical protein